jgi:hypothetical protein
MANNARNENDAPPLPPGGDMAPGFKVVKAVAALSDNLIVTVDRKLPLVVTRQDASVLSSNGDTNHENNPDRNPARNHARSGNGVTRPPAGGGAVPPRRLRQANGFWPIDLQNGHLSEGALLSDKRVMEAAVRQDARDDYAG